MARCPITRVWTATPSARRHSAGSQAYPSSARPMVSSRGRSRSSGTDQSLPHVYEPKRTRAGSVAWWPRHLLVGPYHAERLEFGIGQPLTQHVGGAMHTADSGRVAQTPASLARDHRLGPLDARTVTTRPIDHERTYTPGAHRDHLHTPSSTSNFIHPEGCRRVPDWSGWGRRLRSVMAWGRRRPRLRQETGHDRAQPAYLSGDRVGRTSHRWRMYGKS